MRPAVWADSIARYHWWVLTDFVIGGTTADTHQWSMLSVASHLPYCGDIDCAQMIWCACSSLSRCIVSFPASSHAFATPLQSLFISPILDKSKAQCIALAQLDSASPNHYCKSQSPSFLPPIFLYWRQRINPQCFGKCTGTSTLKAPQILHFISTLHLLSPLPAMLLSHSSFSCLFFSNT